MTDSLYRLSALLRSLEAVSKGREMMGLLGERKGGAAGCAIALPHLSSVTSSTWPSATGGFNI